MTKMNWARGKARDTIRRYGSESTGGKPQAWGSDPPILPSHIAKAAKRRRNKKNWANNAMRDAAAKRRLNVQKRARINQITCKTCGHQGNIAGHHGRLNVKCSKCGNRQIIYVKRHP